MSTAVTWRAIETNGADFGAIEWTDALGRLRDAIDQLTRTSIGDRP